MSPPIMLAGAIGSPYTRKMRALLLYRQIPYRFIQWNGAEMKSLPEPPRPLLPCIWVTDEDGKPEPISDSTFQLRALEQRYPERSVIPTDPALAFLDYLVEDFADEWLTKAMFHYRWGIAENCQNASTVMPLWNLTVPDSAVAEFGRTFAQRQVERLSGIVTGSLEVCGPIIEASYQRLLAILREHFTAHPFVLGSRPSAGDFGLHGQLTQLVQVEPTSMALARAEAPRVLSWVDVVDDLSGWSVDGDAGWLDRDNLPQTFRALLGEIGRTYAPFMLANTQALLAGEDEVHCTLDGQHYWQKAFHYQRKCLGWLREQYAALAAQDREFVDSVLAGTGCEVLLGS